MIGRDGRDQGTREYTVRGLPYIIVYEVEAERDLVTILSVIHGARRR
jgi:plasmid stabilization system protein ParE